MGVLNETRIALFVGAIADAATTLIIGSMETFDAETPPVFNASFRFSFRL